jgi:steroid 5-alpha reductase family enzyme
MLPIFLALCVTLFFWMTWWYFIARFFRRTDIVDMVWWLSYGIIALMFYLFFSTSSLAILPLVFVLVWSARLVSHIIVRLTRHSEDARYTAFRISWWKYFFVKSYIYIFLLQWFFIAIISLPLLFLFTKNIFLTPQFIIGALLWVVWFLCEYFADRQMNEFRANKNNAWKIIQTWLWKYSRHPNYFWELLMWWSLWIMSVQNYPSIIGILSPLLLSYIIIFVTGIPMLEASLAKRTWFEAYKKSTSILILLPRKK